MKFNDMLETGYRIATILIAGGFVMLCQPVSQALFTMGFPILMIGVVLFLILDHVPEKPILEEDI